MRKVVIELHKPC